VRVPFIGCDITPGSVVGCCSCHRAANEHISHN